MSENATRGYAPVTTLETNADDALSVRTINDLADSINNYNRYVGRFKVIGEICLPHWESQVSSEDECVVALFAPRTIPDGYTYFIWHLGAYRKSGSTGTTTFKFYCSTNLYKGPQVMNAAYLNPGYAESNMVYSTNTNYINCATDLEIVRASSGSFLTLTAKNSTTSTTHAITTIDVTPAIR